MINLWYSNHLEQLVLALSNAITAQRTDPLDPITIVVPNRNIATYLKFELARLNGIAANLSTVFVNEFFEDLLPQIDGGHTTVLRREVVRGMLLERIDLITQAPEPQRPEDKEICWYFSKSLDADDRDRRLFQLADRLARLFEEYELSRPDMVHQWNTQTTMDREPYLTTERWQRALWLDLFGPEGCATTQAPSSIRFGELLRRVVDHKPTLHGPVHIFGLSYLSRLYYDALGALGDTSDVAIYALNPCMEYWEDVPNGWSVLSRSRFKRRTDPPALNLLQADDTLFEDDEDPPPLKLWGRPGRDNIRMLNLLTDCNFQTAFVDPLETSDTLLHRLQHDVLVRAPMGTPQYDYEDDSLVILQCPTIQREIEIVASEIWELRRRSIEQGEELRFNEIAVIVNQAEREAYQSRIRAVFKDTYDIPHNIVDITARSNRRFLEVVDLLLELPFSRFTRAEMLRLMTHPNVLAGHPDVDPETWIRWVDHLNIFHGADHEDHANTYIEKDLYNWDQGLKRLVLGAFMTTDVDDARIGLGAQHYVPLEHGATDVPVSARFVRLARELIALTRAFQTEQLPLVEWYDRVIAAMQHHLTPADEEDERDRVRVLEQLHALRDRETTSHPVRYRIAYEAIVQALSALEISRGHYLADGVVVSSFVPMRPIPFKVVFITGLGERAFPRADVQSPLDLRWARALPGDNFAVRRQDEYMFLETLQSTRDQLYLSYIARDSRTGEQLLPSSLVRELEFMLRRHYLSTEGVEALKRPHPLRRFDKRYFPEIFGGTPDPKLGRSVHPEAEREAHVLALRDEWEKQNFQAPKKNDLETLDEGTRALFERMLGVTTVSGRTQVQEDRNTVTFRMLRRFLENPLQGAAEFYLRLRNEQSQDVFEVEDEAFQTPPALRTRLLRSVFLSAWQTPGKSDAAALRYEAYQQQARFEELVGRMPTGMFSETEFRRHQGLMNRWQEALEKANLWKLSGLEFHHFGPSVAQAIPVVRHDPLRLNIPVSMEGEDDAAVDLVGQSPVFISVRGSTPQTLLSLSARKPRGEPQYEEVDFLDGFIAWAVMATAGLVKEEPWQIVVVRQSGFADVRSFLPMSQTAARDWLIELIGDMLSGVHDYRMPAEAVFHQLARRQDFAIALTSYDFHYRTRGVVRDEERFSPPPNLDELIERRFGLYLRLKMN